MPDKRLSPNYLNKMIFVRDNMVRSGRVLDVGCGGGGYFHMYRELGLNYAGIDPDESALPEGENVRVANAERIPFADSSFDSVVCMDVLEHTENPAAAIREMFRVLRPNGRLVISVPSADFPWTYDPINAFLRPFGRHIRIGVWAWGHRRLYKRPEFIRVLEDGGFRIRNFDEVTHGFVCSFMTYVPFVSTYIISPIVKKIKRKKRSGIRVTGKPVEGNSLFRFFDAVNSFDRKHFSKTHGLTLCASATKGRTSAPTK